MSVSIRLSRVGTKHVPFYRIVVMDSRKKRDGECLEYIGTYDAIKSSVVGFKADRYEDWISKGAQPSDSAKKIYKLVKKNALKVVAEEPKAVAKKEVAPKAAKKDATAVEAKPEIKKASVSTESKE